MTADAVAPLVRARHHRRRIPSDDAADSSLHLLVAGEPRLLVRRDGVDVRGRDERRHRHLQPACALEQFSDHEPGTHGALGRDERVERTRAIRRSPTRPRQAAGGGRRQRSCGTRIYTSGLRTGPFPAFRAPTCGTVLTSARTSCEPCLLVNPLSAGQRRVSRIRHTTLERGDSGTTETIRVPR